MDEIQQRINEISIDSEMRQSYLDYAMSVIIGRALPDVRDGLKPVHRRILFAMRELRNDWNRPYKKSARIVGDVIGKYHPHGDAAVYDATVRMAQKFTLRYPFVDGQGNFGSVDGDPPAAMRYTEVRMTRLAHQMLEDIDKDTVDWQLNYDETLNEPTVLPAKVPSLLLNGSSGIAVGMATNIPPHNLSELAEAIKALIDNSEMTVEELIEYLPGPDFPTGGIIYGTDGIRQAYQTGRGKLKIRARIDIEVEKKTKNEIIIIKELPYQVNKAALIEKIATLVKDRQIEGIRYIRDESDKEGIRVAIALKKDQMAEAILNLLYKHTPLESNFGIILLAVVNRRPELMNLKQILEHFVVHRKEIIVRRTRHDLKKAEARAHILEGLIVALDNLDEVVALIRGATSPAEAKSQLMARFGLSDAQAQAILDMRLQRLTGLERDKIKQEHVEVLQAIARYKEILSSEQIVLQIIKDELSEIQETFGDARRTKIVSETREITMEDMIVQEDMVVTISNAGYIKRNPITLYRQQHRGGKGKTGMGTKDEDFVSHLFVASTHHTFMFFTNRGRVYWCKVYDIPQGGRTSRGKAIVNLLNFSPDEHLTTVVAVPEFTPGNYVLMATRQGVVKKTDIMAFSRPRAGGIIAINMKQGDELIAARLTDGTRQVFLCSLFGKSIRFHESDIRPSGRISQGVRGMTLTEGDQLVGMEVLTYGQTLLTATENGYGKRTSIDEYPVRRRGGKGVITIKTNKRNGRVMTILVVSDADDVMLVTDAGKIIRMAIADISVISRNTQGVKLIDMEAGERLVSAARLAEEEEPEPESAEDGQ
ncbi:MAG: DNA gyrase subunit A [Desulfobacterales bacterium]|nr:DNA gyrase subunit A [Desulfobacterales bacterium]MBS3755162.1 DNA gyrase subunit A [Desulfobacterales bacterium]